MWEKEWEYERETGLQTPMSVEKEGEKVLQVQELRFHYSLWWTAWWGSSDPAAHGWALSGAAHSGACGGWLRRKLRVCGQPMLEQFMKNLVCGRDPTPEQGKSMMKQEWQRKHEFWAVPISLHSWGEKVEKTGSKIKPRKKGGVKGRYF